MAEPTSNDPTRAYLRWREARRIGCAAGWYDLPPLVVAEPCRPVCPHGRERRGCGMCVANGEHGVTGAEVSTNQGQAVHESRTAEPRAQLGDPPAAGRERDVLDLVAYAVAVLLIGAAAIGYWAGWAT